MDDRCNSIPCDSVKLPLEHAVCKPLRQGHRVNGLIVIDQPIGCVEDCQERYNFVEWNTSGRPRELESSPIFRASEKILEDVVGL